MKPLPFLWNAGAVKLNYFNWGILNPPGLGHWNSRNVHQALTRVSHNSVYVIHSVGYATYRYDKTNLCKPDPHGSVLYVQPTAIEKKSDAFQVEYWTCDYIVKETDWKQLRKVDYVVHPN